MRASARRLRSSGRWLTLQTRGVGVDGGVCSRSRFQGGAPFTAGLGAFCSQRLRGQRAVAWVLAGAGFHPFRRCGRRPQRRNATEVGFPWAAFRDRTARKSWTCQGRGGVLSRGVRQPAHRGRRSPSRAPRAFLLLLAPDRGSAPRPQGQPHSRHAHDAAPFALLPRYLLSHAHSARHAHSHAHFPCLSLASGTTLPERRSHSLPSLPVPLWITPRPSLHPPFTYFSLRPMGRLPFRALSPTAPAP